MSIHIVPVLILLAACKGGDDTGLPDEILDEGDVAFPATVTGIFLSDGFYRFDLDTWSNPGRSDTPYVRSLHLSAEHAIEQRSLPITTAEVYFDDVLVSTTPVTDFDDTPPIPSRIRAYIALDDGSSVEVEYDLSLTTPHWVDSPAPDAILPTGEDVTVTWSPTQPDVATAVVGLAYQDAETDFIDDVGTATLPGAWLTEPGEDRLSVWRIHSGSIQDLARGRLYHYHTAEIDVVVGP